MIHVVEDQYYLLRRRQGLEVIPRHTISEKMGDTDPMTFFGAEMADLEEVECLDGHVARVQYLDGSVSPWYGGRTARDAAAVLQEYHSTDEGDEEFLARIRRDYVGDAIIAVINTDGEILIMFDDPRKPPDYREIQRLVGGVYQGCDTFIHDDHPTTQAVTRDFSLDCSPNIYGSRIVGWPVGQRDALTRTKIGPIHGPIVILHGFVGYEDKERLEEVVRDEPWKDPGYSFNITPENCPDTLEGLLETIQKRRESIAAGRGNMP